VGDSWSLSVLFFVMASLRELVDALVCDYLIKQDPHLGKIFKKKTLAVCEGSCILRISLVT
jgi:hypothetical protein